MTSNSPLFTVRSARGDDAMAIAELEREAQIEIAQFRGHERLLEVSQIGEKQWPAILATRNSIVMVAVSTEIVVAYAKADFDATGTHCTVTQIFVDRHARQLGIGATLVNEIARLAKANGCTTLDAVALPGDRKMKNLYERIGMPARLLIASKDL